MGSHTKTLCGSHALSQQLPGANGGPSLVYSEAELRILKAQAEYVELQRAHGAEMEKDMRRIGLHEGLAESMESYGGDDFLVASQHHTAKGLSLRAKVRSCA